MLDKVVPTREKPTTCSQDSIVALKKDLQREPNCRRQLEESLEGLDDQKNKGRRKVASRQGR